MTRPQSPSSWWALASGLAAFLAYLATVHASVPGGDGGELAAAACAGGVAHPPGYPLHGVLLRAAGLVGPPLLAFRLVSVVAGAATVALLFDLVARWTGRLSAGALAAAAWFASPLAWTYATTVEVFSLHTCLVAGVAWALTRDVQQPTRGSALCVGLLAGLALTHHHTAVLVVAPLLAARAGRRGDWGLVGAGLALGSAPLLLLPLWSATDTLSSWGDLRTLEGFLTHLLRREYGTFQLAAASGAEADLSGFLRAFGAFEWSQAYASAVALAVLGVAGSARPARRWVLAGLAALLLSLGLFGALSNLSLQTPLVRAVVSRFFLLPHLVLCAAAGLAVGARPRALAWSLAGVLVALGLARRPPPEGEAITRYATAMLAQPAGALVLTQGDLIGNSMRALQACEHLRPDVALVDQQLLTYPWYVARLRRARPDVVVPEGTRWHPRDPGTFRLDALLEANAARPLGLCGGFKAGDPTAFRSVPWGLCARLLAPGAPFDAETWFTASAAALPPLDWVPPGTGGAWESLVQRDAWHARAERGLTALTLGIAANDDPTWLRRAAEILGECASREPAPPPEVFKNLGIAQGRLGHTAEMKQALQGYLRQAPEDDPDLPTLRALVAP